jgi:Phage integrase family
MRDAAGLPGFRFHDLRHTVVTDLLEAGEPEHVIQAVTGQLSKKMLEHYSHQRLKGKRSMFERIEVRRKKGTAWVLTQSTPLHTRSGIEQSSSKPPESRRAPCVGPRSLVSQPFR